MELLWFFQLCQVLPCHLPLCLEGANGLSVVRLTEDGCAGHQDISAGIPHCFGIRGFDAPIDFDEYLQLSCHNRTPECPDLVKRCGQKALPAEAGVDGHKQDHIHLGKNIMEESQGGGRVEDYTRAYAGIANSLNRAMQVAAGFKVHRQVGTARIDERRQEHVGFFNHKMDIKGKMRYGMQGLDDWWTDREIWHEVAVHNVHVQQ
jgi:hypothetical protein